MIGGFFAAVEATGLPWTSGWRQSEQDWALAERKTCPPDILRKRQSGFAQNHPPCVVIAPEVSSGAGDCFQNTGTALPSAAESLGAI